jgi:hypothetical protein
MYSIKIQCPLKNIHEVDEMLARKVFDKPTATPEREEQITDRCHCTVHNSVNIRRNKGCNFTRADLMKCLLVTVNHLDCILPHSLIHASLGFLHKDRLCSVFLYSLRQFISVNFFSLSIDRVEQVIVSCEYISLDFGIKIKYDIQ